MERRGPTRVRLKRDSRVSPRTIPSGRGIYRAEVTLVCELEGDDGVNHPESCSEDRHLYGVYVKRLYLISRKGCAHQGARHFASRQPKNFTASDFSNELRIEAGKPLGSDEIFISQANLRSLGIFDAVNVEYIGHPLNGDATTDTQGLVREATVVVSVEESRSKSLDLYLGTQIDSTVISDELPVLYTIGGSVRDRNFFGKGLKFVQL